MQQAALLIKVGVFQELITSALQKEFAELRNTVAQTSTGCCWESGEAPGETNLFFPSIDMQDIVVA